MDFTTQKPPAAESVLRKRLSIQSKPEWWFVPSTQGFQKLQSSEDVKQQLATLRVGGYAETLARVV